MPTERDVYPDSHDGTSPPDARGVRQPGDRARSLHTRTSTTWVAVFAVAVVLVALVVFMLENTAPVTVTFLGMTGTAPLALVLVMAGLGTGLIVLLVGGLRMGQLRRRIRADRREALHSS